MNGAIISCFKNIIEKFNLYIIIQIFWLMEFYLLAIFSGKQAFEKLFDMSINKPLLISKYSAKIFSWMAEYNSYIFYLAIILLIVGFSGKIVAMLPILRNYNLINLHVDIGCYFGGWLICISATYYAYTKLNSWFVVAPIIIYIVCNLLKKPLNGIFKKIGLSFEWL